MASTPDVDPPAGAAPGALSFPGRFAHAASSSLAWLERTIDAETERLAPWTVAALGSGIALYFSLDVEPPVWLGATVTGLALLLVFVVPVTARVAHLALVAVFAVTLGFLLATLRTVAVDPVPLRRPVAPVTVEGTLLDLDATSKGGTQLLIDVRAVSGLAPEQLPKRVTVNFPKPVQTKDLAPGKAVVVTRVHLMPPPPPAAPGAYDFARRAYFEHLGAVGSVRGGEARLAEAPTPPTLGDRFRGTVWRWRHTLAERVLAAISDPSAAGVAVALVTGLRSAIPKEADDALRGAGLTHTLSISGLHLSLIAFGVFAAVRFVIALVEPLALRINGKKWAAAAALGAVAGYFALTGMSIPAQRSFVMLALVLVAILADRRAFSLRNVAIAAGFILILFPEALLDAGFQMSFAAVIALVSAHEADERRRDGTPADLSLRGRAGSYFRTLILASLVASAATAPFGLYHFQVVQDYGVLGNLVSLPILGTIVMPAVALAYVLLPLGLDHLAYAVMGFGLELMLTAARWVSALPGAVHVLPAAPVAAFGGVVFGGLWLALWQRPWRYWGTVPIVAGLVLWACASRPDILVSGDGRNLAARGTSGELVTVLGSARSYQSSVWLRRDGQDPESEDRISRRDAGLTCDDLGCLLPMRGDVLLAVSKSPGSLADDCATAAIVIALEPVRGRCTGPQLVVDRFDLWRAGAHAIWLEKAGFRVETVRAWRGVRPWAPDVSGAQQTKRPAPDPVPKPPVVSNAASGRPTAPAP